MSMEYPVAARRDAARAKLMRKAAALLREIDIALMACENEAYTVAVAVCMWELEEEARACDGDALCEYEDTQPYGLKVPR